MGLDSSRGKHKGKKAAKFKSGGQKMFAEDEVITGVSTIQMGVACKEKSNVSEGG